MVVSKADFIDDRKIFSLLDKSKAVQSSEEVARIIDKAALSGGLTPEEAAALLHVEDPVLLGRIYDTAKRIKEQIYGKRLVFFVPLYISDYCINNCVYCGYRRQNRFGRRKLTMQELRNEVTVLEKMGHKRIAMECGEDPENCSLDYVIEAIDAIYSVKQDRGCIRRINVNIAATTVEDYKRLHSAGIGTYILFQETYHRPTYAKMHPFGAEEQLRLAHMRIRPRHGGGYRRCGGGCFSGSTTTSTKFWPCCCTPCTLRKRGESALILFRFRGSNLPAELIWETFPYLVSDLEFKKLVAIIRLAGVPIPG